MYGRRSWRVLLSGYFASFGEVHMLRIVDRYWFFRDCVVVLPRTCAIVCCCHIALCLSDILILIPCDLALISIPPPLEILCAVDFLGVVGVMVGVEWEFGVLVDTSRDEGTQLIDILIGAAKTNSSILPLCSLGLARHNDELCANLSGNCHSGCEHPWLRCQFLDRNLCQHSLS